jgi:hypothetical protein
VSVRIRVRLAAGVLAAVLLVTAAPAAALAVAPLSPAVPAGVTLSGSAGYTKPPAASHADRAPWELGSGAGLPVPVGPAVPAPVAPAPDGSGAGMSHVSAGSVLGKLPGLTGGTNAISFSRFDDGDIVVVLDPTSFAGHAGLFDHRYYVDIRSYAMVAANVAPANGVQREQCLKYRTYEEAYGLWVPREANHGVAARDFACRQMGKPYSLFAAKTDLRSFYCSKLVWVAWRYTSGLDLDADGGYWVWPVDLVHSRYTSVFGYWG